MYGRLALHAESVVLPLLAPDAPVVTWWHGHPPHEIATDALGVLANRRVTDSALAPDPVAALGLRAQEFSPGDTDLAWTRATPWRSLLASALDGNDKELLSAQVSAEAGNPSALLLVGWLRSRLGIEVTLEDSPGPGITAAVIVARAGDGSDHQIRIDRPRGAMATMHRGDEAPRSVPLARRELGDLMAEELRRMDTDLVYAEALGSATGVTIDIAPRGRVLVWRDPALTTT
jgi:glucose-6-phosphate dehydrogenase assembly protein OpcA